jgi:hypothetical protein
LSSASAVRGFVRKAFTLESGRSFARPLPVNPLAAMIFTSGLIFFSASIAAVPSITGIMMSVITALIFVSLLLVAIVMGILLLFGRSRRKAIAKARAEQFREANRPLKVWICRYCGFLSLMRSEVCSGCGSPRPDEFIHRTIPRKDFATQIRIGTEGAGAGKAFMEGSPDADGPAEFRNVHPPHQPGR